MKTVRILSLFSLVISIISLQGMELSEKMIREINNTNGYGETRLSLAIHNAQKDDSKGLEYVRYLLDHGADVNQRNKFGVTPLLRAMFAGKNDIALLLLEYDADVNIPTCYGCTPLEEAVNKRDTTMVTALLEKGAEIEPDNFRETPLALAKRRDFLEIVRLLENAKNNNKIS